MPSLARSVPKPLKVPSLARSVPKFLKCLVLHVLFFLVLIWDLFDFTWDLVSFLYVAGRSSHLRGPRREPACIDGRKDGRTILKSRKNMVFGNISKSTQYFFLIVSGPHRRLLKTTFGSFRIGKIGNFSTQKSPNIIFWKCRKKHAFQEYLKNYSTFFPDCFCSPQKNFKDIF